MPKDIEEIGNIAGTNLIKVKNVIGRRRNARTAGMREALTRLGCRSSVNKD